MMYGSGLGKQNADKALSRALIPLLQHLTLLCLQMKSQVANNPERGIDVVRALNDAKSPLLKTLNCLVGADDPRRIAAHDEVATAIRDCLIDCVNKTEAWSVALPLFENCLALAQEPTLQSTLSEDIAVLHRNLDLQRRAQPPGASATASPPSGPADSGSTQRSPSAAHTFGFAIGRKSRGTPLFDKAMIVLAVTVIVVALSLISGTSNSGTTPTASPALEGSPASNLSPSPAYGASPGYSTAATHSLESAQPANDISELETLKTEVEESKAKLKSLEEEIQAINSDMSGYTTSIDSDRSTLDRIKGDNNAGMDVDQEQYERIRSRYNQSVATYNRDAERHNYLLRDYHTLLAETNSKVDKYNSMVKSQ